MKTKLTEEFHKEKIFSLSLNVPLINEGMAATSFELKSHRSLMMPRFLISFKVKKNYI